LRLPVLTLSTLLIGAAISGMHYIGMAAMVVPGCDYVAALSLLLPSRLQSRRRSSAYCLRFACGGPWGGWLRWARL
jgi:NO-binding membrane sensor protein with MHYT domain